MMTTVYITHESYRQHRMLGHQHPEHPGRIKAVWELFQEAKLPDRMQVLQPSPAPISALLDVHTQEHIDTLQWISSQHKMVMFDADTYALPQSYDIARLTAGGILTAVDAILRGEANNGLAAVRPPGHHATPNRAMGFCLLSNIAIAARYAQKQHGIERVMIVDYDVHHGNGTQDAFYEDGSVLFISTHQYPFYPGTGSLQETGIAAGEGTTINIPLGHGHGDESYRRIYESIVWPAARRFQPELILVSAGFDAHFVDPLAMMQLSHKGYAHITRELVKMAQELCGGKIVFVMEGGYDLPALAHGMRNIAHVILDEDEISDPYGATQKRESDVAPIIESIQYIHEL